MILYGRIEGFLEGHRIGTQIVRCDLFPSRAAYPVKGEVS
jgi:hypothetical protein